MTNRVRVPSRVVALVSLAALLWPDTAAPYPINGRKVSGIRRLDGYVKAQEEGPKSLRLVPGAKLPLEAVALNLVGKNESFDVATTAQDPKLAAAIAGIFKARDPSYSLAIIDITDPEHPAWAGLREDRAQYPGSVGKILCMTALFDGLRRAFPDPEVRARVLRETQVVASDWVVTDSHKVPYTTGDGGLRFARIQLGDSFTLSEWVDHMVSSSANAAGSIVWKEAILLREFGSSYPVSKEKEDAFFKDTPKSRLTALSQIVINEPLVAAGLDLAKIQQGTMWTRTGQRRIPGIASFATPRELARWLLRLEQGRLVDAWSSLEMKRYLYMTKRRYRYVYAPELSEAAAYFKSGSLYECKAEEGFRCGKYKGNVKNFMNSIAIIETPATHGPGQKRYIVAMMSNVLRVNSAWDHSRVAAAIDAAVRTREAAKVVDEGSALDQTESGRSE